MKTDRSLSIYFKLLNNEEIKIGNVASEFDVSTRTIERDIETIRNFLTLNNKEASIIYDKNKKTYSLVDEDSQKLTKSEILAITKILLDSRAFLKNEMHLIINKLVKQCTPKADFKIVEDLVKNEKEHYIELQHKKSFIHKLWDLGEAIKNKNKITIFYTKLDSEIVERKICPVGLMFSEFYFYLLAHIENIDKEKHFQNKDDIFPTIYRVDRIQDFKVLKEQFNNFYYKNRFEEGEFRKKIQFMTGGKLRKIKFLYKGNSLEAVLDKIPTATVKSTDSIKNQVLISAEVFGNGIDRWIRSQGEDIEIVE